MVIDEDDLNEDEAEYLADENPHGMNPPDDAGVGVAML